MSHIVGIVGYESEDIVLYLAECLSAYGKKVAIEDRTEHATLPRMLELAQRVTAKEGETALEHQGIMVSTMPLTKENYDMIFLLFGYRVQHPKLYECETLILVTDDVPAHATMLREIGQWERKQMLFLRNHIETKHGIDYLKFLTGQRLEQIVCVPWEEKDAGIRCCLGTDTVQNLYRLSVGMKHALKEVLRFLLPELPEEFLSRIGKKGKRGIAYWEG